MTVSDLICSCVFPSSLLLIEVRLLKTKGCQGGTFRCHLVLLSVRLFWDCFYILRGYNIDAQLVVGFFDCYRLPMLVTVNVDMNRLILIKLFLVLDSVMLLIVFRVCLFEVLIFLQMKEASGQLGVRVEERTRTVNRNLRPYRSSTGITPVDE